MVGGYAEAEVEARTRHNIAKSNYCAFAHFLPHLTHSFTAKNTPQQKNRKTKKTHKRKSKKKQTSGSLEGTKERTQEKQPCSWAAGGGGGGGGRGRWRNFRQLVSSMDALRCGWFFLRSNTVHKMQSLLWEQGSRLICSLHTSVHIALRQLKGFLASHSYN